MGASDDPLGPVRPIDASHPPLHYGPSGQAYAHNGPEAQWGGGAAAAPTPHLACVRGHARGPTPFVPAHHERWGAFLWVLCAGEPPLRVLLGPMPAAGEPWLPPDGEAIAVFGRRARLHGEDVLIASSLIHAGRRHLYS